MKTYDIVVIGGGPAGLSAGVYAGRALRSVLIIDKGDGRWAHHQVNENYLGFPDGISAKDLRANGKKQATKFGAEIVEDEITEAKTLKAGFSLKGLKETYHAKAVILACGVKDYFPSFPGSEEYIGRSLFWCLLCDGYKIRDQRVAIIGFDDEAVGTYIRLKEFTKDLVFLTNCDPTGDKISAENKELLAKHKTPLHYGSIAEVKGEDGMVKSIVLDTGEEIKTDYIFSRQGAHPHVDLAQQLGVILEGKGYVKTDVNKRTNVPYVYAAGDVTSETAHQVATAVYEGATAVIAADHDLREDLPRSAAE